MATASGRGNSVEPEAAPPARECSMRNSWAGLQHPFCSSLFLVWATNLPVGGGEVLLLLELLLQAHELDLSEDGPAPAWLLGAWWGLLCLWLAAALGLTGGTLGACGAHAGLGWQHAAAAGGREQRGQHGRLPGDDGDEGIRRERRGAWQGGSTGRWRSVQCWCVWAMGALGRGGRQEGPSWLCHLLVKGQARIFPSLNLFLLPDCTAFLRLGNPNPRTGKGRTAFPLLF